MSNEAWVRWVFRFDTQIECANFVLLIDNDEFLRSALAGTYYRLSLATVTDHYCIIFHSNSVPPEHQGTIKEYAKRCGGKIEENTKTKNFLTTYALLRFFRHKGKSVRWDEPNPKVN